MRFARTALSSYNDNNMRKGTEDNKMPIHTITLEGRFSSEGESVFKKLSRKVLFLKRHAHKAT